jgi:hypothetical protein
MKVSRFVASFCIRAVLQRCEVAVFVILSANFLDALAVVYRTLLGLHDLIEYGCACAVLEQYDGDESFIAIPCSKFHSKPPKLKDGKEPS